MASYLVALNLVEIFEDWHTMENNVKNETSFHESTMRKRVALLRRIKPTLASYLS